ncbi:MAG: YeeE/YedE family protein [Planctomycetes bacterium]|nr:YeeE/YedE family protein [Planctomycetota bacterium]
MKPLAFIASGAVFGFLLSMARATDAAAIVGMFRLTDLHLFGVIGSAIATAALGIALLKRSGARTASGEAIALAPKPYHRAVVVGGVIFGLGWGLSATCPGTALAQLGEGKLYALPTIGGILLGTWIQQRLAPRAAVAPARSC